MPFFQYGAAETDYLSRKDPALGRMIERVGPIRREVIPDLFEALINSVVGQQISTKAHATIWSRIKAAYPSITPALVRGLPPGGLQSFGISLRKEEYIRDAAERILSGALDLNALAEKTDAEVCRELSSLRGIGVWTAEMLLLFSMQRPDVLSYSDLAIQRGMRMLYRHREITPKLFERYRRRYSPCGSVASLYLWAVAGGAVEGLSDPAPAAKQDKRGMRKAKEK